LLGLRSSARSFSVSELPQKTIASSATRLCLIATAGKMPSAFIYEAKQKTQISSFMINDLKNRRRRVEDTEIMENFQVAGWGILGRNEDLFEGR
jgi:hypothetical protein